MITILIKYCIIAELLWVGFCKATRFLPVCAGKAQAWALVWSWHLPFIDMRKKKSRQNDISSLGAWNVVLRHKHSGTLYKALCSPLPLSFTTRSVYFEKQFIFFLWIILISPFSHRMPRPHFWRCSKNEFFNLGATDVLGQILLCCGGCCVHCGSILGPDPVDASSTPLPELWQPKKAPESPKSPTGCKIAPRWECCSKRNPAQCHREV